MRLYICTLPRKRTLIRLLCAAAAISVLSLPSPAEKGREHGSTAQAELHINVIVVQAVMPPRHHDRDRHGRHDDDAVVYDLQPQGAQVSVSEEVRPMLVNPGASDARHELVQITTVVKQ